MVTRGELAALMQQLHNQVRHYQLFALSRTWLSTAEQCCNPQRIADIHLTYTTMLMQGLSIDPIELWTDSNGDERFKKV